MQSSQKPPQQHGVLVLDKPRGPTSTQCLERIKKGLGQKKIGHAGTLDPLATGVLLVALGKGTKLTPYLAEGSKVYSGWIRLGMVTDTYDTEGNVVSEHEVRGISQEEIKSEIAAWTELEEQRVPPYAAAKHQGRRLYQMARQNEAPPEKSKPVSIDRAQVLDIQFPFVRFRVTCSKGTYIRSLAHSLGTRLGCGAVLSELTREESEPFGLQQAVELDDLLQDPQLFQKAVLPLPESLPHWPRLYLTASQAREMTNGNWLKTEQVKGYSPQGEGEKALFLTPRDEPVALVQTRQWRGSMYWAILRGLWSS